MCDGESVQVRSYTTSLIHLNRESGRLSSSMLYRCLVRYDIFTTCLCISPDLDGYQGTKNETLSPRDSPGERQIGGPERRRCLVIGWFGCLHLLAGVCWSISHGAFHSKAAQVLLTICFTVCLCISSDCFTVCLCISPDLDMFHDMFVY